MKQGKKKKKKKRKEKQVLTEKLTHIIFVPTYCVINITLDLHIMLLKNVEKSISE
jgi:hypothetical protein